MHICLPLCKRGLGNGIIPLAPIQRSRTYLVGKGGRVGNSQTTRSQQLCLFLVEGQVLGDLTRLLNQPGVSFLEVRGCVAYPQQLASCLTSTEGAQAMRVPGLCHWFFLAKKGDWSMKEFQEGRDKQKSGKVGKDYYTGMGERSQKSSRG